MADNITTSNATLATDDIGGVHFPRSKVTFGPDGSSTDVSPAAPLPTVDSGSAPSGSWAAITPADSNLAARPRAVWVGGAGTIVVRGTDAVDATFNVAAGTILPIRPTQIRAASTATNIVGLY